MNAALLEKILACPKLPSLPATAAEVITLCRGDDVAVNELARTICKDPALTIQVLKVVNSAQYALRNQVTTISHALALLGINTVKMLALGFSLIGVLKDVRGEGFDPSSIWRRSLVSAVGARSVSLKIGDMEPEEAFLSGLLQDLGVLALIQAIGRPYVDLLRATGERHAELWTLEREHLQLDHAQVGEALAKQWNLPPVLSIPIRYHEQPEAATGAARRTAYAVALGSMAASPFLDNNPHDSISTYLSAANEWFGMDEASATEILRVTGGAGPEMSALFDVPPGQIPDVEIILAQAKEVMKDLSLKQQKPAKEA